MKLQSNSLTNPYHKDQIRSLESCQLLGTLHFVGRNKPFLRLEDFASKK